MNTLGLIGVILSVTVSSVRGVCNITAAKACINKQSLPADQTQCNDALKTLMATEDCVDEYLLNCTDSERTTTRSPLVQIQNAISDKCAGSNCAGLGMKWTPYQRCIANIDLESLLTRIKSEFNKNAFAPRGSADCLSLIAASRCLRAESRNCDYLRREYGQLYMDHITLRQIQEVCGYEVEPTVTQGPIIKDCEGDEKLKLQEIIDNCPFQFNYSDPQNTIIHACRDMQVQIDCALAYQKTCPQAVTKFLKPRIGAYFIPNTVFCGNMTMNSVEVKSITQDADSACNKDLLLNCFYAVMRPFGDSYTQISNNAILQFLQWNEYNDKNICEAFKTYNATSTGYCLDFALPSCSVPFPTFGSTSALIGANTRYKPELYAILETGPVPINVYGARFLDDRRDVICYEECSNVAKLSEDLTTSCEPELQAKAEIIMTSVSPSAQQCSDYAAALDCAANISRSCPLLYDNVIDLLKLELNQVTISKCSHVIPELLPADYFTTTPPTTPLLSTTSHWTAQPTRTIATTRDPRYTSTTTTTTTTTTATPATTQADNQKTSSSSTNAPSPLPSVLSVLLFIGLTYWSRDP